MTVRAKFQVTRIEDFGPDKNKWAHLHAVYSNDTQENADFTKMTPAGNIGIMISPQSKAFDFFKPGEFLYVDFSNVPKPQPEPEKLELAPEVDERDFEEGQLGT